MSNTVKLSARLAKDDELNGIDSLGADLVDNPDQVICAIVWLDVAKVTHDVDSGDDLPTVRVRRIEPFGTVDKTPQNVIELAAELYERRTGRKPLPFTTIEVHDHGYDNPTEDDEGPDEIPF